MNERDHHLDAAWRAASVEAPPTALDDAIRAAARRDVGASPRRRSPTPHWWPLAAAATVAALAVGIVELIPPDAVNDPPRVATAPIAEKASAPAAPSARPSSEGFAKDAAPEPPKRATSPPTAAVSAPMRAKSAIAKESPQDSSARQPKEAPRQAESMTAKAETAPALDKVDRADSLNAASSGAIKDVPRMQTPFPAATPPAAPAAVTIPPSDDRMASAQDAARKPAQSFSGAGATPALDAAPRQETKIASANGAPLRPVDEWVASIRRLRAEGKIADAAKELAAFHDAYKERAESLLPNDLKATQP
jgi:hypothetical protein